MTTTYHSQYWAHALTLRGVDHEELIATGAVAGDLVGSSSRRAVGVSAATVANWENAKVAIKPNAKSLKDLQALRFRLEGNSQP